jgi:hypothetical protein
MGKNMRASEKVWYHATTFTFDKFKTEGLGTHFGNPNQAIPCPASNVFKFNLTSNWRQRMIGKLETVS